MIDISRLIEAREICRELELDDKDIVLLFSIYNRLESVGEQLASYSRTLGWGPNLLAKLETTRKEIIDKIKDDLRTSNTKTNTNQ